MGRYIHGSSLLSTTSKLNSNTPLSLHTLPATKTDANEPAGAAQMPNSEAKEKGISMSTSTIPRLISVVEIIKREYLNASDMTVLSGLHQYNEIGHLEQREANDAENGNRSQSLAMALEGKNYPKEKKSAYMRITLSKNMLPHLITQGATYQLPSVRKLSKSAKARGRKRQRRMKEGEAEGEADIRI